MALLCFVQFLVGSLWESSMPHPDFNVGGVEVLHESYNIKWPCYIVLPHLLSETDPLHRPPPIPWFSLQHLRRSSLRWAQRPPKWKKRIVSGGKSKKPTSKNGVCTEKQSNTQCPVPILCSKFILNTEVLNDLMIFDDKLQIILTRTHVVIVWYLLAILLQTFYKGSPPNPSCPKAPCGATPYNRAVGRSRCNAEHTSTKLPGSRCGRLGANGGAVWHSNHDYMAQFFQKPPETPISSYTCEKQTKHLSQT